MITMSDFTHSISGGINTKKILKELGEAEEIAEDILGDRGLIVELEKRRNALREATRALERENNEKVWVLNGLFFVKMTKKNAMDVLKRDQTNISEEVGNLRIKLKDKVDKLRDVENEPSLKGFNLKPLSKQELAALGTTPRIAGGAICNVGFSHEVTKDRIQKWLKQASRRKIFLEDQPEGIEAYFAEIHNDC